MSSDWQLLEDLPRYIYLPSLLSLFSKQSTIRVLKGPFRQH